MVVNLQNNAYSYDEEMGMFVNGNHKRIAEILVDLDPGLVVLWEPSRRNYAVAHLKEGSEPYIIFTVPEDAMDERVVHLVLEARASVAGKQGSLADRLERADQAKELVQAKELEDLIEQERDMASFMWTTPLHNVKMPNGRTYRL